MLKEEQSLERIDRFGSSLCAEMHEIRNEKRAFHEEIIGYLKRAEYEHAFAVLEDLRRPTSGFRRSE